MKKRVISLMLVFVLLLSLPGCGKIKLSTAGLLSKEEIAQVEPLFGQNPETVREAMGLGELERYEEWMWLVNPNYPLPEFREIEGVEFEQRLVFADYTPEESFICLKMYAAIDHTDSEQAITLAKEICRRVQELYGEPVNITGSHVPTLHENLEKGDDFDSLVLNRGFHEYWRTGGHSGLEVQVARAQDSGIHFFLDYSFAVWELDADGAYRGFETEAEVIRALEKYREASKR